MSSSVLDNDCLVTESYPYGSLDSTDCSRCFSMISAQLVTEQTREIHPDQNQGQFHKFSINNRVKCPSRTGAARRYCTSWRSGVPAATGG
jgi:hypothetical protein